VLMNYGGILLDADYLRQAYALCEQHDIPTMVDEIQSCIWSPQYFLYREYGLRPDFVSIGKGFPGGEYPASRILTTAPMDNLSQFGALVTNGQEELASLAYLVTMTFLEANRSYVDEVGKYYQSELERLAGLYPGVISEIEGFRHLSTIFFHQAEKAIQFIAYLNEAGIDISAQTYKADCPPAALTKLPLISSPKMVDFLIEKMDEALRFL
jgi:acetylornithine/succinyldiaminopimelate/putrescine aminotransferase